MTASENNKRIAKNTLLLYIRMLFSMAVTLYTSRVVLNTLGVDDYGIYNVVGGVVAMFGFLNTAMSTSTQRYLTFELGKGDFLQLQKVFSVSLSIHFLIAIAILILGETVGLWFLYHKMVIPETRMEAARWVYQFSVLSTMVAIVSVPYNAAIIAHEKMSAFAYISVLEVVLKLLIVYLLMVVSFDKLKLYAALIFVIQLTIRFVYGSYCSRHFQETKFRFIPDKALFKEILGFAGWNLWGNIAGIAFTQGLNILLNMFFGPVVNAARGIAVQVQGAINQFSMNFQTALNPQITKSYATKDYTYMHSLIYRSSKFTFFLLLFFSLPVFIKTNTILTLWLKIVPEHTVVFLRLILCTTIIDAVANPIMVSATATGRVKVYQSAVGGLLLAILPLSYTILKWGEGSPESVFIVHLCICVLAFIIRLWIVRPLIQLSIRSYFRYVILRCALVIALAIPLPILIANALSDTFVHFTTVCAICVVTVFLSSYFIGLNSSERKFVNSKVSTVWAKMKN